MTIISQKRTQLKPEYIRQIRRSRDLKSMLALHLGICSSTLQKWLDINHSNFTEYGSLEILANHFNSNSVVDLMTINELKRMPMEN